MSYIKVQGHLRSIYKSDWHQTCLIATMGPFVCSCYQRPYTRVKGHQTSSCKMGWKCESGLKIWSPIGTKLAFLIQWDILHFYYYKIIIIYWYNEGTFTRLRCQRSQMTVKGYVRSICQEPWKCDTFAYLRTN